MVFFFSFQMHHPIQMKPADSENRNGKFISHLFILLALRVELVKNVPPLATLDV